MNTFMIEIILITMMMIRLMKDRYCSKDFQILTNLIHIHRLGLFLSQVCD